MEGLSFEDIMKAFTAKIKSTPLLCPKCEALPLITISQQKLSFVNFYCFCGYEYTLSILKLFNVEWIDNVTLGNIILKGGNILDPDTILEFKKQKEKLFTECIKTWEEIIFSSSFFTLFPVTIESECTEHSLKYEYFCRECSSHLCSTCYNLNHLEHSTEKLNSIINIHVLDKKLLTFKDAMTYIVNTNLDLYKDVDSTLKTRCSYLRMSRTAIGKEEAIAELQKEQMNLSNDMSTNARVIDCMAILYKFCLKLYNSMKTPCNYFIMKNMKEMSYFHIEKPDLGHVTTLSGTEAILQHSLRVSNYLLSHFLLNNKEEGDYFTKFKMIGGNIPLDIKYVKCVNSREYGKHKTKINAVLVLSNGNIAIGAEHPTIKIFNKDNMRCDMKFLGHKQQVNCLCEIDKKHFVSCSDDNNIIIWSIKSALCRMELMLKLSSKLADKEVIQEHTGPVLQMLTYGDEPHVLSLSKDKTIKVFSTMSANYKVNHTFRIGNSEFKAMCIITEKMFATCSDDKVLRMWTLDNYTQMKTVFENIECAGPNSMKALDSKTLLVGNDRGFVIVDLQFMVVVQRVVMDELENVNSFVVLNKDYFITGSKGFFYLYEYYINEAKLILKVPNNHEGIVGVVVKQNDKQFVSGGSDSTIKIWEVVYEDNNDNS